MGKNKIFIYDTTLRDGTQCEGVSLSVTAKLRLAEKMDKFGFDFIEGGWPGSNPRDMAFFEQAKSLKLAHAKSRRSARRAGRIPRLRTTGRLRCFSNRKRRS